MFIKVPLLFATVLIATTLSAQTLSNQKFTISTHDTSTLQITSADGSKVELQMRFLVQFTASDPLFTLRQPVFPGRKLEYNVSTWLVKNSEPPAVAKSQAPVGHIADGYDPIADAALGAGRTADVYAASKGTVVLPNSVRLVDGKLVWGFDSETGFGFSATLELPAGTGDPSIRFELRARDEGWYSVAFVGAPSIRYADVQDLWQPLLWQERRLPDRSYLTEAFRCPVPMTIVQVDGTSMGVLAAPEEMPFQPLPTWKNSRFGVALRSQEGDARPALFAPILGGPGSFLKKDSLFQFHLLWIQRKQSVFATYEDVAINIYGVSDYRQNVSVSLNRTFENMVDYAMGPFARFNDELRGAAYDTDVPGSVKNISALHPLSIALITDDAEIWDKRARPMIEYGQSRERFLFSVNPAVKGQGATSNLKGPGVSLSELAALYAMSGKRDPFLLDEALSMVNHSRSLNLDSPGRVDWWGDRLALYEATGEEKWLNEATSLADIYLKSRVQVEQQDFSDKSSGGMFFWTSFVPQWMQLYHLWEVTGQQRYLQAAREGADRFTEFIWMSPRIPPGNVVVNQGNMAPLYRKGKEYTPISLPEESVPAWRVSEIGLTPEAAGTSKGHRGIFLTTFAPFFLKIGAYSQDPFLEAIGRDAVVGRYTSFPGYHMNTARTTVYEKPDFAARPLSVLNSTTSLHYNHIWPQIAMVADFLISDAETRSHRAISFPSRFAEGYGYVSTDVYGDRSGSFFGDKDVWLWMPKGLATSENVQLNYVAGRSANSVYFAFTNQSEVAVSSIVHLNDSQLHLTGGTHSLRLWDANGKLTHGSLTGGSLQVSVPAHGFTALAIDGVKVATRFQDRFSVHQPASPPWQRDSVSLEPGGLRARLINMGPTLSSVYLYSEEDGQQLKKITIEYNTSGVWESVSDESFPFEFTIPLAPNATSFKFRATLQLTSGQDVKIEDELHQ